MTENLVGEQPSVDQLALIETPRVVNLSDGSSKLTKIVALLKHWEMYHLLMYEDLKNFQKLGIKKIGRDSVTGLKIYEMNANKPIIYVKKLNPDSPIPPCIVTVDDWGEFTAIESTDDANAILDNEFSEVGDAVKMSTKKLHFEKNKWDLSVVEIFDFCPDRILVGLHGVWAVDDDYPKSDLDTLLDNHPSFPCPLTIRNKNPGKAKQETKLHEDDKQFYPENTFPGYRRNTDFKDTWHESYQAGWSIRGGISKQTCAYDATSEYLRTVLGVTLTTKDRDWYVGDGRVQYEGLPIDSTLTVLSELVEPYGVEIDKVWLDEFTYTDEIARFAIVLGWEASDIWRMYRDQVPNVPPARIMSGPLPLNVPMITFTRSNSAQPSGHATYRHPRDIRPATWTMAISYRRKPC